MKMHVKDIMNEEVVHVDKDQNIQDALKLIDRKSVV
jgi:predicted transcriptional regulator